MPPSSTHYRLLAIDLDGTLLLPEGRVSDASREAIGRAGEAGIRVVIATGRGLYETTPVIEGLPLPGPLVLAGGALVSEYPSGKTVVSRPMEAALVGEIVSMMVRGDHSVLMLKDRCSTGLDYVVVGEAELDRATQWWFDHLPVIVKRVPHLSDDPWPAGTLRLGVVTRRSRMQAIAEPIVRTFGSRAFVHYFPALTGGADHIGPDDDPTELLEVFALETGKWTALQQFGAGEGIPPEQIAVIGDEINDLGMIRHAGLGVAMGNAPFAVRRIADHITLSNREEGVAHAIERILAGDW